MDRMKDSGSFDWGSSPHGITTISINPLSNRRVLFLEKGLQPDNLIEFSGHLSPTHLFLYFYENKFLLSSFQLPSALYKAYKSSLRLK